MSKPRDILDSLGPARVDLGVDQTPQIRLDGSAEQREQKEELEHLQDQQHERQLNSQHAGERDSEMALLREQLAEQGKLIAKILADGHSAPMAAAEMARLDRQKYRQARYARVRAGSGYVIAQIQPEQEQSHNWPVPVIGNEVAGLIPRGVPVRIPLEMLEILENAELEGDHALVTDDTDPRGSGFVRKVHVYVQRFPVVVMDETGTQAPFQEPLSLDRNL